MFLHPFDDLLAATGALAGAIAALGVIAAFGRRWVRQAVTATLPAALDAAIREVLGIDDEKSPADVVSALREGHAVNVQAISDLRDDMRSLSVRVDTFRTMVMSYFMRGGPGTPAG